MMDWVLGIAILIVSGIMMRVEWRVLKEQWRREDEDDAEFERKRADRQAEFERHAKEVRVVELFEVCETAKIGDWRKQYDTSRTLP